MSTLPAVNPLSSIAFEIPFRSIRAEHVQPGVMGALEKAKQLVDAIADREDMPTYDNTLGALEAATEGLEYAMGIVGHLESVATEPALREAYNAVQGPVAEFYSSIPLNSKLYARVQAFATTAEAKQLDATRARFLKKSLDDFRRHGAELDLSGKQRLSAINVELTQITTKFAQNVLDHLKEFEWVVTDDAALSGLPESAIAAARQSAEGKGVKGWRFTLQQPSYTAVMTYLNDGAVRERFYRAYNQIAVEERFGNFGLIQQIVALRQEKAKLLGYRHFADLTLEDRMAKEGKQAIQFLEQLESRSRPAFERERAELQPSGRNLKARTLRPFKRGTWATTPRSCAWRGSISTKRLCAPTLPFPLCCRGCSLWWSACSASRWRSARTRKYGTLRCATTSSATKMTAPSLGLSTRIGTRAKASAAVHG